MKAIKFYEKLLTEIDADVEIVIVVNKNFDQRFVDPDKELLKEAGFEGEQDEVCLLPEKRRLYVGADSIKSADIRSASAVAIRSLAGKGYRIAKMASYMSHPACTATLRAQVEGLLLGGYRFERYKSKHSDRHLHKVRLSLEEYNGYALDIPAAQRAVAKGIVSAEATNFVRDIVNTAPDDCYPETMARIAAELGRTERETFYREEYETLVAQINAQLWDEETGFYYDRNGNGLLREKSYAGLIPFIAGAPDEAQTARIIAHLTDPAEFWSEYGIRSLSADSDIYEPGYSESGWKNSNWRGPVWMPVNYLLVQRLEETHPHLAEQLRESLIANVEKQWETTGRFWEYYHAETGEGLGADHQTGWTALVANLIHEEYPAGGD
jgi:hypothetical protein